MGAKFSRASAAPPAPPASPPASSTGVPAPSSTGVPIVVGTEVTPPTAKPDEKAVLQQLDLVFTMDCTGSMGSYISAAKKNIEAIVEKL
eukprot:4642388-Prymnesium_polylepis.1